MKKLKLIATIAVSIGLFALSTQSSDRTKEEVTEQIIADLDNIQGKLDNNSHDPQVAARQLEALEKLREDYQQTDAFNEPGVLDWYSAVEERALRILKPPSANQSLSVSLNPGEKIGTLEVKFVGKGGQVSVFRITAGLEKYAGITEINIMQLARESGLEVSDIGNLAGKRVIFKPIEKSRELTQSGGAYPHALIIAFLKD